MNSFPPSAERPAAPPSTVSPGASDAAIAQAVQRAKRELERMIDLNPQAMLMVDRAGKVSRANRAFVGMVGAPGFAAVLGRPVVEFFRPDDPAALAGLLERPECPPTDLPVCLADAARGVFRFTLVGLDESDMRVLLIEDVTRETEAARGAERSHKLTAVRAMAGALMHNVNQPLTVISVRAKLMLMAIEKGNIQPERFRKNLEEIVELCLRIAAILSQVENPRDYVTQNYLGDLNILDLERSNDTGSPG